MKTIPTPTDTEEQREIVKALIEAESQRLEVRNIESHKRGFNPSWVKPNLASRKSAWMESDSPDYCAFRLTLPESNSSAQLASSVTPIDSYLQSDEAKQRMAEECTCGFDSEGWRDRTLGDGYDKGDQYTGDKRIKQDYYPDEWIDLNSTGIHSFYTLRIRTRRHKPDCPAQKLCTSDEHAKETAICEHEFIEDEEFRGFYSCQKCGLVKAPNYSKAKAVKMPPVEPFSLEEDCKGIIEAGTWQSVSCHIVVALRKIVERINMEAGK